jgi:hypothetical protein
MKAQERCHNCGHVDSIHVRDYGTSKLLWVIGPKNEKGLQQYIVYCRLCRHMSVFIPGWIGNWKHVYNISPDRISGPLGYRILDKSARYEDAIGMPKSAMIALLDRMKQVLKEDGLWTD